MSDVAGIRRKGSPDAEPRDPPAADDARKLTSVDSRAAADRLNAHIASAKGGPAYPAEMFATRTCGQTTSPSGQKTGMQRFDAPAPKVQSAKLLVESGVSLSESLATTHEMPLAAFEKFVADYLEASRGRPDRLTLYADAVVGAPRLIEARRAIDDKREDAAVEQELARAHVEATKAILKVRPPLSVLQVAAVNEIAEPIAQVVSFVADLAPYHIGSAKLLAEAATGRSMLGLGRPLTDDERLLTAACAIAPYTLKILRLGAATTAQSIALIAARSGRTTSEVLQTFRFARAIEREGLVLREAIDASIAGRSLTSAQAAALGRARAHGKIFAAGGKLRDEISPAAEGIYETIRANPNDVAKIAQHMNLPLEVVERAKRHLFMEKHTLTTVVGETDVVAHFVADDRYALLWKKGEFGALSQQEQKELLNLIVHENVEARLHATGLPLLEPGDLTGYRPFRGELAHDLAGTAERDFVEHTWMKISPANKKRYLRPMLEAVYETRGPYPKATEMELPPDVRAEYQKLLKEKGR